MLTTLAQAASTDPAATQETANRTIDLWAQAHHVFKTVVDIFSQGAPLANPEKLIGQLGNLGQLWALVFVVIGLVCLLNGYKFHKIATVAILVILGATVGYWMGMEIKGPPFVVAGCLSVLLAVLAFPLMKYAVAILGGLSGAFIGANLWGGLANFLNPPAESTEGAAAASAQNQAAATEASGFSAKLAEYVTLDAVWVGALIGLVVCGIAAFLLSKITIHLFTSVSGSTIAVFGVIALLLSIETFSATVQAELTKSALIIPLLVFVPAAIGFLLQEKSSGAWGGGGGGNAAPA